MKKEIISTKKAPSAIGPYSQGMIVGDYIFTSGQIPLNPENGQLVTESSSWYFFLSAGSRRLSTQR